jgi:hypothetical protein
MKGYICREGRSARWPVIEKGYICREGLSARWLVRERIHLQGRKVSKMAS